MVYRNAPAGKTVFALSGRTRPPARRLGPLPIVALANCVSLFLLLTGQAKSQQRDPSKPYFLVATDEVRDPYFEESVILMLPLHQGTLVSGLIINKPTKMSVNSLFPQSRPLKNKSQTVYFGGPVDPTQYSLIFHSTQPPEAATRLFQDVYLSVDADYIARVLKGQQPVEEARLFAGRAQWTSGQLEGEMLRESWRDVPADPNLVFSQNPGGLWKVLVERSQWQEVSATGGQFGRTLGPKL